MVPAAVNRPFGRVVLRSIAITLLAASVIAQSQDRSPAAVLSASIKSLIQEARQAKTDQRLPRQEANFARTVESSIPPSLVGRKLVRTADRDPFIDAYVRWQLTGFGPTLPAMNDRQFQRFLSDLPSMIGNPRAAESLLSAVNAALGAGVLSEAAQEAMTRQLDRLAQQTGRAQSMNRPATRLYDWIAGELPTTGIRPLQLQLVRLNALVDAGWPVERAKSKLEALFAASARDRSFTTEQRRLVASQAQQLIGKARATLRSARFVEGALIAEFDDTGVYDFDVRRWTKSISRN